MKLRLRNLLFGALLGGMTFAAPFEPVKDGEVAYAQQSETEDVKLDQANVGGVLLTLLVLTGVLGGLGWLSYSLIWFVPGSEAWVITRYGERPPKPRYDRSGNLLNESEVYAEGVLPTLFRTRGFIVTEGRTVLFPWDARALFTQTPFSVSAFASAPEGMTIKTRDEIPITLDAEINLKATDFWKLRFQTPDDPLQKISGFFDGPLRIAYRLMYYAEIQGMDSEELLLRLGISSGDTANECRLASEEELRDLQKRDRTRRTGPPTGAPVQSLIDIGKTQERGKWLLRALEESGVHLTSPFITIKNVKPPQRYQDTVQQKAVAQREQEAAQVRAEAEQKVQEARNKVLREKYAGRKNTAEATGLSLHQLNQLEEWIPVMMKIAENNRVVLSGKSPAELFSMLQDWGLNQGR